MSNPTPAAPVDTPTRNIESMAPAKLANEQREAAYDAWEARKRQA